VKARSDKSEKATTFQSFIDPSVLFPNLMAASILALLNIATALAIASLIFSGPLVPFISMGIGMFLIATVVGGVAVPAASGYKAILSAPRGGQSPILPQWQLELLLRWMVSQWKIWRSQSL